jgi:L-fuculose-phosphate aldolase
MERQLSDQAILEDLVGISRRVAELGFVVAAEGNTSARGSTPGEFWIKRSGCGLGDVSETDFIKMDVSSAAADPENAHEALIHRENERFKASIEAPMHATIYSHGKEINFIVHVHSPSTLAGCCTKNYREFFVSQFPDSVVCLGSLRKNWVFLDYASPGPLIASALADALREVENDLRVVILQNHGSITMGKTAYEAISRAQILEKTSYVRLMSVMYGGSSVLDPGEVEYLENEEAEKYRQRVMKGEI